MEIQVATQFHVCIHFQIPEHLSPYSSFLNQVGDSWKLFKKLADEKFLLMGPLSMTRTDPNVLIGQVSIVAYRPTVPSPIC